jgi:hypothetical protein
MSNFKTSLLVNRQVPEFIREEHPLFITFLEAYYEYLENKQGDQINDLVKKSKELRFISDVDESIDDFEDSFFNTFASLVPKNTEITKEQLIKNLLPVYLSKGSENSFKLLFRMLFGQELEILYPKNDVLRASDGKWKIDNVLKYTEDIRSYYVGDGEETTFKLIQESDVDDISVYVDDVLKTINTDYVLRKETKKIIFVNAPSSNSSIEVLYSSVDKNIFNNRRVTGKNSGATALIEKTESQFLNSTITNQFFIDSKTLIGTFTIGEDLLTSIVDSEENLINVKIKSLSTILSINIINGGSNYNVGDPVIINSPGAEEEATAIVSRVFSGLIDQTTVLKGGAGFDVGRRIAAVGFLQTELDFAIGAVNTDSSNTANTFRIFTDVISDVDPSNVTIDALDWHFPGNISPSGITNVNSTISHAFSNGSYVSIGDISNVTVLVANVVVSSEPTLNADPATLTIAPLTANTPTSTIIKIDTFGSLGRIEIHDGGQNYNVNDELVFTNKPMSFGFGAEAVVTSVSAEGEILEIDFVPSKISGTVNTSSVGNVMVEGSGTQFLTELVPNDFIYVNGEVQKVNTIASNESLNVYTTFSSIITNENIRLIGKNLIGGQGYTQDKLPDVSVSSTFGTGSNISVSAIMGDGEEILAFGSKNPGEIEQITLTNPGSGIKIIPQIILTNSGDGLATANASLTPIYEKLTGRWTTSDSILSSDRKIQGRDYYVNYSYLLSSEVEFSKYKTIFKQLMHPAGFKEYAEYKQFKVLQKETASVENVTISSGQIVDSISTLSGTVNVSSSIYVTGTNTKFNVAESLGILTIGSSIAINSEIRTVSSVISNTNLSVTSAFTITSNNEEIVVIV